MYGGDDTRIIVYNMERWLKKKGRKTPEKKTLGKNPLNTDNRVHQ